MANQNTARSLDEAKQHFRKSWRNAVNDPLSVVRNTTRRFPWATVAVTGAAGILAERGMPIMFHTLKTTLKTHPEWLLLLAQQLISARKK
ncbi:MAG: hypothetical protein B7X28_02595 [Halothiobacillus sp. 13-55-253]|jgi:hypothetical protein|nr:MAG: hypothetical protein B7X28_02595 [Halothiobacillus sp. 13-55-253]